MLCTETQHSSSVVELNHNLLPMNPMIHHVIYAIHIRHRPLTTNLKKTPTEIQALKHSGTIFFSQEHASPSTQGMMGVKGEIAVGKQGHVVSKV